MSQSIGSSIKCSNKQIGRQIILVCLPLRAYPNITPSLAALDDAQALMRKEWRRGEPGEDIPRQYPTICGHLTPTQPRHEDMQMESTLNVTPEGSLSDIPAATRGNANLMGTQQMLEAPETDGKYSSFSNHVRPSRGNLLYLCEGNIRKNI